MLTVEEIEFKYNLEYTNEIKNKYGDIIIKIFNHENIDNDTDPQIKIIKAHYYIGNNAPFKGEQLLLELVDQNNVDGIYNLALYYYINEEYDKTMEYLKKGTDLNHINSSINLAYLYYIYKDYENFHKYNKIGIDNNNSMALIYNALYIWHVKKDEKTAKQIFLLEGEDREKFLKDHSISLKRKIWMKKHGGGLWDADHIIPVKEGGGLCGLENMRTLCIKCHKNVTALLYKTTYS